MLKLSCVLRGYATPQANEGAPLVQQRDNLDGAALPPPPGHAA